MADHHGETRSWTHNPFELGFTGPDRSRVRRIPSEMASRLALDLALIESESETESEPERRSDAQAISKNPILSRLDFLERDAVLVAGKANPRIPAVFVFDGGEKFPDETGAGPDAPNSQLVASVGPWQPGERHMPDTLSARPYFHENDLEGIAEFVRKRWKEKTPGLKGLVLTGGKSTRMGRDKAVLSYGGGEESRRVFRMLEDFCGEVYISCREDQARENGRRGMPQIHDSFKGLGPVSGILSALGHDPESAWLVVACDLPRLETSDLRRLIDERNPFKFASAYRGHRDLPEPLCAIYEPKSRARLLQFLAAGSDCPRKMMINSPVQILEAARRNGLDNVNVPEEYERVLRDLGR